MSDPEENVSQLRKRYGARRAAEVSDLVKDRKVYSIDAGRTVLEAARFMMEHNVGALPVLRNGELAGIFSERDIMNRVVAAGRTPGTTEVSEVMTANPRAVAAEERPHPVRAERPLEAVLQLCRGVHDC